MYMNFNENAAVGGLIALLGGALIFFAFIAIVVVVFQLIAQVKVYKKAGKAGWEAIVPFYRKWVLCEIAGVKWWFFLIICATTISSILGLIFLEPLAGLASLAGSFVAHYNLAIKFGKDGIGYGIGLTLLPVVFYAILGFSNASFNDVKLSSYGPFTEEKVESTFGKTSKEEPKAEPKKKTSTKAKFCKNCGAEISDAKFCPNCGTEIR